MLAITKGIALFSNNSKNVAIAQRRCLWEWVNMMFNKVDNDRVKAVGPNIACAEWLLRNGGAVRFTGAKNPSVDYNTLPTSGGNKTVEEIDASESSISHYGFPHLRGCKDIKRIVIHKCKYIDDAAINGLKYVESPLQYLQISSCAGVTDKALLNMPPLTSLQNLVLFDLPSIENMNDCEIHLKKILPSCKIEIQKGT